MKPASTPPEFAMLSRALLLLLAVTVAGSTVAHSPDFMSAQQQLEAATLDIAAVRGDSTPRSVYGSDGSCKLASELEKANKTPFRSALMLPTRTPRIMAWHVPATSASAPTLQADHVRLQI